MTICDNCIHHVHIIKNKMAPEVWYNHLCSAHPLPLRRNAKSGKLVGIRKNDIGGEYETDDKFEFCRRIRINDEFCSKFEENKR